MVYIQITGTIGFEAGRLENPNPDVAKAGGLRSQCV